MARTTGILPISANFEPRAAEPFDSRSRVETLADLSLFETWDSGDDNAYTYPGMIVSVYADSTPENNGLYYLSAADYTDINNWVKISETLRPQITEDTTIYIDNVDGSNETGDGTESNPYESLEYALKRFEYYILPYKLVFILVNNGVDNPHIVDMTEVKTSLATITGAAANVNTNIQIVGSLAEITDTFEISRGVEVIYEYTTTYTTTEENELRSYMLSSNGLTPIGQIVESGTDGSLVINSTTADLTGTYYLLKPTSFESAHHLNGDFELNVADDSFLVNLKWLDIQWNLERTSNIRLYANYVRFRNESGYSIRNLDTREQSEVRLSFVIFEQFRLNLYKSLACTNTTFIGDNTTSDGTGLVTGGGENFGGTMMFIDCLYAIRATGNIGLGGYSATLTGMYFKNNTHIFMISNEGANIHLKPYSNVVGQFSFRGVQNFVYSNALKPNTTISFSTELYGDLPTNIPTPYIDLEKNIQLRIPGITETDTRRLLPQNYQTVAEVKLLTSDYQFVFCEETGLLYHYETNFDEIVDGVNILNTADGGTTRFVNISGMSAISGLQDALNSKANTNHTHLSANITDLTDAIDENENVSANTAYRNVGHIPIAEKGTAFGVAELDGDGVIPESQLPPIEIDLKLNAMQQIVNADMELAKTVTNASKVIWVDVVNGDDTSANYVKTMKRAIMNATMGTVIVCLPGIHFESLMFDSSFNPTTYPNCLAKPGVTWYLCENFNAVVDVSYMGLFVLGSAGSSINVFDANFAIKGSGEIITTSNFIAVWGDFEPYVSISVEAKSIGVVPGFSVMVDYNGWSSMSTSAIDKLCIKTQLVYGNCFFSSTRLYGELSFSACNVLTENQPVYFNVIYSGSGNIATPIVEKLNINIGDIISGHTALNGLQIECEAVDFMKVNVNSVNAGVRITVDANDIDININAVNGVYSCQSYEPKFTKEVYWTGLFRAMRREEVTVINADYLLRKEVAKSGDFKIAIDYNVEYDRSFNTVLFDRQYGRIRFFGYEDAVVNTPDGAVGDANAQWGINKFYNGTSAPIVQALQGSIAGEFEVYYQGDGIGGEAYLQGSTALIDLSPEDITFDFVSNVNIAQTRRMKRKVIIKGNIFYYR